MKHMLKLVFTFLLLGTSAAFAQSVDEPEVKPFHFSSRDSAFGLQADFEGTYRVYDSSIEVHVTKATLYVSEHCPYQGRRQVNYIKFGLWNAEGPKRLENSSTPLYVSIVMSPRDEHTLTDLRFSLPKESTLDLEKRWFVVEMQEDALDLPSRDDGKRGFSYVHSCPDIFARGVRPTSDQKPSCK